jgi:hypothetical protein
VGVVRLKGTNGKMSGFERPQSVLGCPCGKWLGSGVECSGSGHETPVERVLGCSQSQFEESDKRSRVRTLREEC